MAFNYFYGKQADLYGFVRVPKLLMTEKMFDPISIDAKLLYGLLIDRMSMAKKNDWIDEENRVYVLYPIAEMQEDMGVSKKKAIACLADLEKFGLVEKKVRGLGLPNLLYIKNVTSQLFKRRFFYVDSDRFRIRSWISNGCVCCIDG